MLLLILVDAIKLFTYSVVAICVVFVVIDGVGAVGIPVNEGASIVLLLYLTTVVLVCQITTQIKANTFVLGSFVMLSVVGHSMDRSKRLNFAHFVETQQENTILQGKLEKVAEKL